MQRKNPLRYKELSENYDMDKFCALWLWSTFFSPLLDLAICASRPLSGESLYNSSSSINQPKLLDVGGSSTFGEEDEKDDKEDDEDAEEEDQLVIPYRK